MIDWTSQRTRMIAAAAGGLLVVLGLAATPWRIGDGPLRAEAERRIRAALAAPDAIVGPMSLTLLPSPRLRIESLSFTRADGSLSGMAQSASVAIKVDPLLRGVAKPTGLALVRPTLSIRPPGAGEMLIVQAEALRKAVAGLLTSTESLNGLDEIEIEDGRLHLLGPGGSDTIESLRLRASVASASKPLKIVGSGRHAGAEMRLSFAGASPSGLTSGVREPVALTYSVGGTQVEFRGEGSLAKAIDVAGIVTATTASVAELPAAAPLLASFGIEPPRNVTLRAGLEIARGAATLRDLSVLTDRARFDGVGALRHDGQRWQVNATLATPALDLAPVANAIARMRGADGGWSRQPFNLDALFGINLDLRISADQASAGQHVFNRVGMAMIARPSRIEASVSDSAYNGGRARARLVVTRGAESLEHRLTAMLDGVDIGGMAAAAGLQTRLTGQANAELALDASGNTAAQIVTNLDGKIGLTARSGDIVGIDLNRLALRRASRPDLVLADALSGRTAFESAVLSAKINRGQISPIEGTMQASRLVGTLGGEIDIARDDIRLQGNVVQLRIEPGLVEPVPVIDFSITGALGEPRMTPNIAALLKRS